MIKYSVPIRNRERSEFEFEVGSCFSNPLIPYFDGEETRGEEHPFIVVSVDEKTICCVMAKTYKGYKNEDEKLLPQCKCPLDTEHQRYFAAGQIYVFSKDEVINDTNFTIYIEDMLPCEVFIETVGHKVLIHLDETEIFLGMQLKNGRGLFDWA